MRGIKLSFGFYLVSATRTKGQQFPKSCHWLEDSWLESVCFINSCDNKSQSRVCGGAAFQALCALGDLICSPARSGLHRVLTLIKLKADLSCSPSPTAACSATSPEGRSAWWSWGGARGREREGERERRWGLHSLIFHPFFSAYRGLGTQRGRTGVLSFQGWRKRRERCEHREKRFWAAQRSILRPSPKNLKNTKLLYFSCKSFPFLWLRCLNCCFFFNRCNFF